MDKVHLIVLDPGHFHAALVQKSMYDGVDSVVNIYAPDGPEIDAYRALINKYNTRSESPTSWNEVVYKGEDYLEKMLLERPGNLVMLAGNNRKKAGYIKKSVDAGLNVLADKPMAINTADFELLNASFESTKKNKIVLYDIMTSRYDIINILQRELSQIQAVFGELEKGSMENPAVVK
ncbi:MAG: oxidoreductase, partial [Calditrichaeota bacterium]|nr:oxidoreductase [Calditrichota bacterium]